MFFLVVFLLFLFVMFFFFFNFVFYCYWILVFSFLQVTHFSVYFIKKSITWAIINYMLAGCAEDSHLWNLLYLPNLPNLLHPLFLLFLQSLLHLLVHPHRVNLHTLHMSPLSFNRKTTPAIFSSFFFISFNNCTTYARKHGI